MKLSSKKMGAKEMKQVKGGVNINQSHRIDTVSIGVTNNHRRGIGVTNNHSVDSISGTPKPAGFEPFSW